MEDRNDRPGRTADGSRKGAGESGSEAQAGPGTLSRAEGGASLTATYELNAADAIFECGELFACADGLWRRINPGAIPTRITVTFDFYE